MLVMELLGAFAAYLYGSVPFAWLAAKIFQGKDLRVAGTGNIGITKAFKAGGTVAGICGIVGEISKAALSLWLASTLCPGSPSARYLLLFCALSGTSFSIFLKGRGGKGSTAAAWGLLVLSPYACLALLALWLVVLRIARNRLLIKKIPLVFVPVVIYAIERDLLFTLFGALASVLMAINSLRREDDFIYYGIFTRRGSCRKSTPEPRP